MQPTPVKSPKLPSLTYPHDVAARMKASGNDPLAAEQRLAGMPRDEAETTLANVIDYYRHSTDMASKVAAYQGASPAYQQARMRKPANESWTTFDDMGSRFKNSFMDLAQGVTDFIPSTVDLAMSAVSNPSDTSWYRQWDKATDDYFAKSKYYVSPEAQAALWDEKTGLNWRAVAGMAGSTMGFLTSTMLPLVGQVGRAGRLMQGGSLLTRAITDPRLQSGAIGYLQSLPGYKESALNAGFTRNQAAVITPVLSAAQSVLEFAGADALIKGAKLAPAQASRIVRQLGRESALEGFSSLAGRELSEEAFRDVINVTGKRFFGKLAQPEVRQAILQNIKARAITEGLEELTQTAAEKAIEKMADLYYGYGAEGGKGFDPTVKQLLIESAAGVLMGGAVGGSMGGFLGAVPTSVGQQTIWGKLDSDVRKLLNNNPDLSLENNKAGLPIYRMAESLAQKGKLSEEQYFQAMANLDHMAKVSERLAKTSSADAPTRYALYNLDSEQRSWLSTTQMEVDQPLYRLAQLADERSPGEWFPKADLSALDLNEAHELISQNLPRKAQLAQTIQQTINESIAGLANPQTRQQVLASYRPRLDALAEEWDNGPVEAEQAPDRYNEDELSGLVQTLDTPDGRFALVENADGRQVVRVETQTDGARTDVSEDKDPVVGRFKGYQLPSKGQPVVTFHTIADQTRHDELLDAFERNSDAAEDYGAWRSRLAEGYGDDQLTGLEQAQTQYQQERDSLPADAPDWQRQDLARKQNWLKAAYASRASDSNESRYGWANWAEQYLADELKAAKIDAKTLAKLPTPAQAQVVDLLQSGELQQAAELVKQAQTGQTNIFDESLPTTPGATELSTQLTAATERGRSLAAVESAINAVLDGTAGLDEAERFAEPPEHELDTEQRLVAESVERARALAEESAAIAALDSSQSGEFAGAETGTGESEAAGDSVADELGFQPDEQTDAQTTAERADELARPAKRDTRAKKEQPIDRQPQDWREAILQYFSGGGRMRRSDLVRYGDANMLKGAKGGNPYLVYTAGDEKAPGLDTLVRQLWEETLGRPAEQLDEQAAMQEVIDLVESFAKNGTPRQQLSRYQQAQTQAELDQSDAQVAQLAASTPLETLEPLMSSMDQVGVPLYIQDQLLTIIADSYVTPDGLDWVGVVHLLRANGVFERYNELRDVLWPMIDEAARRLPITNKEYADWSRLVLADQQASRLSADAWEQVGHLQALSDNDYNQLTDLFYGPQPTDTPAAGKSARERTDGRTDTQPGESAGPQRGRDGAAGQSPGLSGAGDNSSGSSGADATENQLGEAPELTSAQQQRVDAANAQFDADRATLERHNDRLEKQAESLRKQLKSRVSTGELFGDSPTSAYKSALADLRKTAQVALNAYNNGIPLIPNTTDRLVIRDGQIVDVGYMNGQQFVSSGVPVGQYIKNNPDVVRTFNSIRKNQADYLNLINEGWADTFVNVADKSSPEKIVELIKAAPSQTRKIFESLESNVKRERYRQLDLTSGQQTGIDAESAVKERLLDIERQIAANQDRIENLEASRQKALEVVRQAAEQTVLFQQDTTAPAPLDSAIVEGLVNRLKQTFGSLVNEVTLLSQTELVAKARELAGSQFQVVPFRDFTYDGAYYHYHEYIDASGDRKELFSRDGSPITRQQYEAQHHQAEVLDASNVPYVLHTAPSFDKAVFKRVIRQTAEQLPTKLYEESVVNDLIANAFDQYGQQGIDFTQPSDKLFAWEAIRRIVEALPDRSATGELRGQARTPSDSDNPVAFIRRSDGTLYGFLHQQTIYLNADRLNANTPIHEFGHLWGQWAKQNQPKLYREGLKKARQSPYYDQVVNDSFYQQQADAQQLTDQARANFFADEALAMAIGDKGEAFVQQAAKNGFKGWLERLWSAIKDKLGLETMTTSEVENLTLDEFAESVAARLLSGTPLESAVTLTADSTPRYSYGPAPTATDQPVRPVQNPTAQSIARFAEVFAKNSADRQTLLTQSAPDLANFLRQTFEPMAGIILRYAPDSAVANGLKKVRGGNLTLASPDGRFNPSVLDALAAELIRNKPKGSEATGRLRDMIWSGEDGEPTILTAYRTLVTQQAILNENGDYEWPDQAEESRDVLASIQAFDSSASDPAGVRLLKGLLTAKWAGNVVNPETVGKLLSLGEGSALSRITKDIRRVWNNRAAEVRLRRNRTLGDLSEALKGLSRFASPSGQVGDMSQTVKTLGLGGYQDGKATTLELPIGDWLDIYLTIRTQLATTGRMNPAKATSTVLADLDQAGQLIPTRSTKDRQQQLRTGAYGYQYTAPGEDRPKTLLISQSIYQQLEQTLQTDYAHMLKLVEQTTTDPVALSYVGGLYEAENGLVFPVEKGGTYYPTQSWTSPTERDSIPTMETVLEEARFLQQRTGIPLKVVGRDVLARLKTYANTEHRYIANSATRLNLTRWRKRNADALDQAPNWLTTYLIKLEHGLNNPYANQVDEQSLEFEVRGVDLGLRAWLRRFSRSTFAFSLTTGPKQLITFANAFGLGIIDNTYLQQASRDLARLAVDSYKLAKQNADRSLFGGDLAETSYLQEAAQNPYLATVMDRLIGSDEAYLGRPTGEDMLALPLDAGIALARQATHAISDVGLRWIRAADRAVILSFWKAAQYQVTDKVAKGLLKDTSGQIVTDTKSDYALREIARLTEELTYATNTMSGEGDASALQRDRSITGAILGLYSGQQQRLFSTCVSAVNDWLKARAIGDPTVDQLRDRAIWTSANLLLFNAVGVAMVNLLYKALTGLLTGEEPQEEVLASLSWDVGRNLLGSVPSVPTEVLIAASSWVDGPRWSDEVLDYAPGQSFEQVVKGLVAAKDYLEADDEQTAAKRWNTLTANLIDGGAHLTSLPVQIPKLLQKMSKAEPINESDWQ
ncbi:hypothetical protein [Spirosoma fluminis]